MEFELGHKMLEAQASFEKTHPYKGANTLEYVQQLKKEGFSCRLEPRNKLNFSDGNSGRPYGMYETVVPYISCEREPSQFAACKWFRVGIAPMWPDSELPYAVLAKQLATVTIAHAVIVCNGEPKAAEYEKFIAEGVAKGTSIVIE